MILILFKCKNRFILNQKRNSKILRNYLLKFDYAWITSFIIFFFLHMFDISYFDGRISFLAWILLAGIRQIMRENQEEYQSNII